MIYEIAFALKVLKRSEEERSLPSWRRLRNKDYETRMQRLRSIQAAKICSVMRDEDQIALDNFGDQMVILGRGQA